MFMTFQYFFLVFRDSQLSEPIFKTRCFFLKKMNVEHIVHCTKALIIHEEDVYLLILVVVIIAIYAGFGKLCAISNLKWPAEL